MGWGGMGWGANNVLRLHSHRRVFLRNQRYTSRYGCYVGCTSARHGLAKKLGKFECKDFLAASNQNLAKIRLVYLHFAEEKKRTFCKHRTHTPSRNPCHCDDLSATYTSPKCHFHSRQNMSREPSYPLVMTNIAIENGYL